MLHATVRILATALLVSSATATADAPPRATCPEAIKQAALKAVTGTTFTTCKPESSSFEVKLVRTSGAVVEVDVARDGSVLQIEEIIPTAEVPAAVTKAFAAKYSKATITRAEKQTRTGKGIFFELAFTANSKQKEATFTSEGSFVEEE